MPVEAAVSDELSSKTVNQVAEVNWKYFFTISAIGALGGILFGFDTAVISGTIGPLETQFQLSPAMLGWTVSSVLLGSVFGAAVAGPLSDRHGRKLVLILSAALFLISALGSATAPSLSLLIVARLVGGVGVGFAGMVCPLYIAEISPERVRGAMVGLYQLAICVGVLAAYFSNDYVRGLAETLGASATSDDGFWEWQLIEIWRAMFGTEVVPAGLFFFLLLLVPESPRYLAKMGHESRALEILSRISNQETAKKQLGEIHEVIAQESGSLRQLFEPGVRRALLIALYLSVFSQLSGIDLIIHYGPEIFESAEFSFADALDAQVIIGVVLVVFTVLAMWTVDSMGRRKLLAIGNIGVFLALVAMGSFFYFEVKEGSWLIVTISVFIACFAFSLGPIPWIVMSEIFPTKIRGRAMAIATLVLFASTGVLAYAFPIMQKYLGEHGTFWLLAGLSLPTFLFVWKVMPETKGRTLEEIEQWWSEKPD